MDTTKCIDNTVWERYADKTLSPARLLSVQKHAETCELCADIMEGIDAMANPEMLAEKVSEINAEVDEYLKPKKKRTLVLWYWSAAAAVLITAGLSILLIGKEPVPVADKPPITKEKEQPAIAATTPEDTNHKETAVLLPEVRTKKIPDRRPKIIEEKKQPEIELQDNTDAGVEDFAPFRGNIFQVTQSDKDAQKEDVTTIQRQDDTIAHKAITYKGIDSIPDTVAMLAKIPDNIQYQWDMHVTGATSNVTIEAKKMYAMPSLPTNLSNNNYTTINNGTQNDLYTFKWVFSDSIYYNNALTYFNEKDYDSCLKTLENIIYTVESEYYEDALMLKAEALISKNKQADAKAQLNKVVALKKKRHKEAKRLLETIK